MKLFKSLGKFNGSGNVDQWLNKFDVAMEIDEINEKRHNYLIMLLDGPAFDVWQEMPEEKKKDVKKIKEELQRVFGTSRLSAWRLVKERQISNSENLEVASQEIRRNLRIAAAGADIPDALIAIMILDALPTSIREDVKVKLDNDFNSQDVIKVTQAYWSNDKIETIAVVKSNDKKCFSCGRYGHDKKTCTTKCYNCNEIGHISRNCPKLALNDSGEGKIGPKPSLKM